MVVEQILRFYDFIFISKLCQGLVGGKGQQHAGSESRGQRSAVSALGTQRELGRVTLGLLFGN